LILSQTDKASLIAVLDQQPPPKDHSIRVKENFEFFQQQLANPESIEPLCKGLAKLIVVDISLNRDQDNPQLIFESLNSTGLELSQADLIRNFILMGLETPLQTLLYEQYWRPMEVNFGQEAYASQFDSFMRHYLTVKTGEIPTVRAVYEAFKQYARSGQTKSTEELVADIRTYASHYCAMALGTESDQDLKAAFHDIRELKVDVAYPFFLELYHDYTKNVLTRAELLQTIRLVESYVFRRAVCAIPTNSMNKTFGTFSKVLKKDRYVESIQAHFLTLPSYRRFPGDEEFEREIQARDLYNFRSRSYWLRRMENHDRKERVVVDEYTIEHIMPQNENVSDGWKTELGPDWQDIHGKYLHTLGNLTLTGYNPELSDRPFSEKKKMKGGFAESPLRLNQGLAVVPQWNKDAIEDRAKSLAKVAASVWASPKLPPDVLQAYKPTPTTTVYSIDDHPHLAAGPLRPVFDEFRKQVLALDPCVTEEFLKLYVAYKAETNFVDVVPQAKRLRLSLNLAFPEINDPRGICNDVTGVGRWGNGDVEVGLSSLDDLPYILGLVRQAYEKQMGSGAE
jgi:predicted transport protein